MTRREKNARRMEELARIKPRPDPTATERIRSWAKDHGPLPEGAIGWLMGSPVYWDKEEAKREY